DASRYGVKHRCGVHAPVPGQDGPKLFPPLCRIHVAPFLLPRCYSVEPGVAATPEGGPHHAESPRVRSSASPAHGGDGCCPNLVDSMDARSLQAIGFHRGPACACEQRITVCPHTCISQSFCENTSAV